MSEMYRKPSRTTENDYARAHLGMRSESLFVQESFHVKRSNLVEVCARTDPDLPSLIILDHEANWRRCLQGSVTASDGITLKDLGRKTCNIQELPTTIFQISQNTLIYPEQKEWRNMVHYKRAVGSYDKPVFPDSSQLVKLCLCRYPRTVVF